MNDREKNIELGNKYFVNQSYPEAERCYKKVLDLDPNDTNAWYSLGITYRILKNYAEAERCYKKVLELDPNDIHAKELLKDVKEKLMIILTQKLEKMPKLSDKIRLDVMQDVLDLDRKLFNKLIFDWAENYGFRISGDYIVLENANIDGFISSLDEQFALWQSQSEFKKK